MSNDRDGRGERNGKARKEMRFDRKEDEISRAMEDRSTKDRNEDDLKKKSRHDRRRDECERDRRGVKKKYDEDDCVLM